MQRSRRKLSARRRRHTPHPKSRTRLSLRGGLKSSDGGESLVPTRFTPMNRAELNEALQSIAKNRDVEIDFGPVATWNTEFIEDMSYLSKSMPVDFDCTSSYDISNWDMRNVKTMHGMFMGCRHLQRVDCSGWDTYNVEDMGEMFRNCTLLEHVNYGDLNSMCVISVSTMASMFQDCSNLRYLNLSMWLTPELVKTFLMFANCSQLHDLKWGQASSPFLNLVANVRSMFWGVPPDAQIVLNLNPWQWYLATLSPNPDNEIIHTQIPSLVLAKGRRSTSEQHNWFGPFTLLVLHWQHLTVNEVCEMVFWSSDWSDVKGKQLTAVVNYLAYKKLPSLSCIANCTTPDRKQWRSLGESSFRLGAASTPDDYRCIDLKEADEERAFLVARSSFTSQFPLGTNNSSPTVLVTALLHGEYRGCDAEASPPLPMFTVPHGKWLIIVSLSTPGSYNAREGHTLEGFSRYRDLLKDSLAHENFDNNPVPMAKDFRRFVTAQHLKNIKFFMDPANHQPQDHLIVEQFLETYQCPRILYFKQGDNCADKTFTGRGDGLHLGSIGEFLGNQTDRNLFPPYSDQFTLSQLCYQMFTVSGYSTILLIDFSCSPFTTKNTLPVSHRRSLIAKVSEQRFGGGSRRRRRKRSTPKIR